MKRAVCFFLILSFFLSACQPSGERIKEPVTFYYIRGGYQDSLTEAFGTEQREASGHRDDLSYLMALYLMGPTDETLHSPIPAGTRIFVTENTAQAVKLTLSNTEKTLTDAEFSIACACLAMTCLAITQAGQVTINSGSRSVTMTPENLALADNIPYTTEETQ